MSKEIANDMPLPDSIQAEKFVLGAVLIGNTELLDSLSVEDFSLEKHRLIFRHMGELHKAAQPVDRVTLANALVKNDKLQSVDGLSYIVSLDDGMPQLYNAEAYVEILREKARLRGIIQHLQDLQNRAFVQDNSAEILGEIEQFGQRLAASMQGHAGPLKSVEQILGEVGIDELLQPKKTRGIEPPFAWLRHRGFAFGPKTLTTIAAGTSVGKSAMVRMCSHKAALAGVRTAFYSLEVPREDVIRSSIAQLGSVNLERFRAGVETSDERADARNTISRLLESNRLFICDEGQVTLSDIRRDLTKAQNEGDPFGFVIIDYLQLLTILGRYQNRTEEVSALSRGVKHIAQDFGVPVLVASQLSRESDKQNRPPRLSDLRESGSIENDSNNVILMHRVSAEKKDPQWRIRVNLAKQRGGLTDEQDMWFVRRYTRFDEIEESVVEFGVPDHSGDTQYRNGYGGYRQ